MIRFNDNKSVCDDTKKVLTDIEKGSYRNLAETVYSPSHSAGTQSYIIRKTAIGECGRRRKQRFSDDDAVCSTFQFYKNRESILTDKAAR